MVISQFRNEFLFLSNFYPATVSIGSLTAPTVEHAYQAAKFTSPKKQNKILTANSPGLAKKIANDWILERKIGIKVN